MTKKNYIALADAIRDHNTVSELGARFNKVHLDTLAAFIQSQNPRFVSERWLAYVNEKKPKSREVSSLAPIARAIMGKEGA